MTTWIFQGNPDSFDLPGYLATTAEIVWSVNQAHLAAEMTPGDRVYLWRAGGSSPAEAGVVAEAIIVDQPSMRPEDVASLPFWKDEAGKGDRLRVGLRVLRVANDKQVIRRLWLIDDPVLRELRIMRLASETNYRLSDKQAERLTTLWQNTNRDWDRAETVAGLWAYHRTYGKAISKLEGSPVAEVALKIGRAVQGVYNKVMNFRALDPRDARSGFTGGGSLAEQVWNEFYDSDGEVISDALLEAEYSVLWSASKGSKSPLLVDVDSAWGVVRAKALEMLDAEEVYESTKIGQRYRIQSVEDGRIWVTRLDSAKPEYVSAGEVARGIQRINGVGGRIERTGLSDTVAKEVTIVALHPRLTWSSDKNWIEIVDAAVGVAVSPTYTDFGQAPDDDPEKLMQFARKVRAGQPKFRKNLIKLYGGRCAISDTGPEAVLEAAHVLWHAVSGLNHTANGILLRSDIHTLFDSGLIRINPEGFIVVVDPSLSKTPYSHYHGGKLRERSDGSQPSAEYLLKRWMDTSPEPLLVEDPPAT